jgi:hypothetical protein
MVKGEDMIKKLTELGFLGSVARKPERCLRAGQVKDFLMEQRTVTAAVKTLKHRTFGSFVSSHR